MPLNWGIPSCIPAESVTIKTTNQGKKIDSDITILKNIVAM
jgi:hypothetical protein